MCRAEHLLVLLELLLDELVYLPLLFVLLVVAGARVAGDAVETHGRCARRRTGVAPCTGARRRDSLACTRRPKHTITAKHGLLSRRGKTQHACGRFSNSEIAPPLRPNTVAQCSPASHTRVTFPTPASRTQYLHRPPPISTHLRYSIYIYRYSLQLSTNYGRFFATILLNCGNIEHCSTAIPLLPEPRSQTEACNATFFCLRNAIEEADGRNDRR